MRSLRLNGFHFQVLAAQGLKRGVHKKYNYFKNSFKNLLTMLYIKCNVGLMNDPLRPCREGRGERVRLARGGWRPAKHIFAQAPSRRAALCASTSQTETLEHRTEARLAQEGSAWQVGSLLSPALSSTSVWRRGRRGGVPRETHGTATGTVALPNHADTEAGQKRSNRCFGSKCRQIECRCFTIKVLQPKGRFLAVFGGMATAVGGICPWYGQEPSPLRPRHNPHCQMKAEL